MKLNELIYNNNVTIFGFPAFKKLEEFCEKEGEKKVLSLLSPANMAEKGITEYYYPVIPRDSKYEKPQEILDADLDIVTLKVIMLPEEQQISTKDKVIIVSRHHDTIELLKSYYPNYIRVIEDNAREEDIKGQAVVGTLPGTLASYCDRYTSVTIQNYNAVIDGDLSLEEMKNRLCIHNTIKVSII